ncbi:MAG: histone deacetylase family protein [Myxococcota bacterium]
MADDVVLLYDDGLLAHQPQGWDPAHPERLAELRARLEHPAVAPTPEERAEMDYRIRLLEGLLATPLLPGMAWGHPERPERLTAVRDGLLEAPVPGSRWERPAAAPSAVLERVHRPDYVRWVDSLRGQHAFLDPDTTAVSPGSVDAAHLAAGAAVGAVERVVEGSASRAMALVRPPGHHALSARAMGFCLFNNAAVAAAHARAGLGCERVLLVDWDAHHGNGTQEIFEDDPGVLLFDTHLDPSFFPGSGALQEIGSGPGAGRTVNVPLPFRSGDAAVLAAFREILVPVAEAFRPDLVLVSAGFDGHADDLNMTMTAAGFGAICGVVRDIADRHADGRLALVLEGGYGAGALAASVHACVEVLAGAPPPVPVPAEEPDPGLEAVRRATAFHLPRWT